jgi:hypothetical protein
MSVGLVSCDDVKDLQEQVTAYQATLAATVAAFIRGGWHMPYDNGPHSSQAWADLAGRCERYLQESCTLGLFAGSQFDRGRSLVTSLDAWRDYLASELKNVKPETGMPMPTVPAPVPVPKSDVSLMGGMGLGLAAVVAILVLHELR